MNQKILIPIVVGLIVVVGGVMLFNSKSKTTTTQSSKTTTQETTSTSKIDLTNPNLNLCEVISKEKVKELLGASISNTEIGPVEINKSPSCYYYLEGKKAIYLELNQREKVDDLVNGWKVLNFKVEQNSTIPIKNYVVYSEEGKIRRIYLVFGEKLSLTIDAWGTNISSDKQLNFATKLANYLSGK